MSYKRSRSTYEENNNNNNAPYATYGTPLPNDPKARDDGSFVPVWKQEVRDERGRKRLHGAFTGGFSAGYFNTVGSKEGWTPSTFVSSRSNRRKDDARPKAEDFMDEEDLADAEEKIKVETSGAFAGLGSGTQDERSGALAGLFRASGDTMGVKLLRKMGWKHGQGIGPKIRRGARLDTKSHADETYLFAPDDAPMINFNRKTDRKGLGHQGEANLPKATIKDDHDEDELQESKFSLLPNRNKSKPERGGIGVGILNDNGSDEEDPYEVGPRIKYNRVIGADKKKKKKMAKNPALGNTPIFISRTARVGNNLRRCHDGRLPLDGFILAKVTEDLGSLLSQYSPPPIPPEWTSSKKKDCTGESTYISTADAAKASSLDPRSRAALLGEKALPGKSVFDFLSSSARDKLASGSGKMNLPEAKGEIPEQFRLSEDEKQKRLVEEIPKLEKNTALAAMARTAAGPYGDDEDKRRRYRLYLESQAHDRPLSTKPKGMTNEDFFREMNEFYNCARIFKPMTGFMASRFTAAKSTSSAMLPGSNPEDTELISKPEAKLADPAEEAARMGLFGLMTRSVEEWMPTRLLCKRFNVRCPEGVRPDGDGDGESMGKPKADPWAGYGYESKPAAAAAAAAAIATPCAPGLITGPVVDKNDVPEPGPEAEDNVKPEENEAVERGIAHEDVLKAIFGDSDSE